MGLQAKLQYGCCLLLCCSATVGLGLGGSSWAVVRLCSLARQASSRPDRCSNILLQQEEVEGRDAKLHISPRRVLCLRRVICLLLGRRETLSSARTPLSNSASPRNGRQPLPAPGSLAMLSGLQLEAEKLARHAAADATMAITTTFITTKAHHSRATTPMMLLLRDARAVHATPGDLVPRLHHSQPCPVNFSQPNRLTDAAGSS